MTSCHFPVLVVGISLVAIAGCSNSESSAPPPEARRLPVEVLTAKAMDSYAETRSYSGTVEARQTSDLAFQRVGKLIEIAVDEGDMVKEGQLLARLDIRELNQQKNQLSASRAAAQARLDELKAGPRKETIAATKSSLADLDSQVTLATATYRRIASLRKRGASTQQQVDDARSALDSVKARRNTTAKQLEELETGTRVEQLAAQAAAVSQIDAQLEALVVRTEDSHIKAPFSGTIARRYSDTGSTVATGQRILTIMEATRLEARVGLPTDVARSLDTTEAYSFLWRNNSVSGRVKAVMPQVDPTTRNQIVVFEIEPTGDAMPVPGDIIRLELSRVIESRGSWLPLTSLTKGTRGLWSAFVVSSSDATSPDTIRTVALEVIYTDGDRAFVRGTLNDGDRVVASGSHRVVPGQQVGPVAEASR